MVVPCAPVREEWCPAGRSSVPNRIGCGGHDQLFSSSSRSVRIVCGGGRAGCRSGRAGGQGRCSSASVQAVRVDLRSVERGVVEAGGASDRSPGTPFAAGAVNCLSMGTGDVVFLVGTTAVSPSNGRAPSPGTRRFCCRRSTRSARRPRATGRPTVSCARAPHRWPMSSPTCMWWWTAGRCLG